MPSYSQDLRDRVLWALERGEGLSAIARRLEVSRVWVYRVRDRKQTTGLRTSLPMGAIAVPGLPTWSRSCGPRSICRNSRKHSESATRQAIPRSLSIPSKKPISITRTYIPGTRDGRPSFS